MAERVRAVAQDVEKLFARIYQLETRQVAGRRDLEAKLEAMEQRQGQEVKALRQQGLLLEEKASQQGLGLETLLTLLKASPEQQNAVARLATRCDGLEEQLQKHGGPLERLQERIPHLEFTCGEMSRFGQGLHVRMDQLEASCAAASTSEAAPASEAAALGEALTRLQHRVDDAFEALSHHGATVAAPSLARRLQQLEARSGEAVEGLQQAQERAEKLTLDLRQDLDGLELELTRLRDWELTLDELLRRMDLAEQDCASLSERLELAEQGAPGPSGPPEDERPSPAGSLEAVSVAVSKVRMAQTMDQLQELTEWRNEITAEMDRLHRLGRIMEDRLEAFDQVERRTEDLAQQMQVAQAPQEAPRSRSSSPQHAWRALRPQEPGLRLDGKASHVASPFFQGTGWAKAPPRRPYSAGAVRADQPTQLQQLREKLLQAAPALPPELRKQLQQAEKQGVFPKPTRRGRPMSAR